MKYSVLWYVALLLVLIMSWSIRCSWKEQINPAGSSSSTCSSAIQPTFLNSDPRTTSGDKSPFLSVSPRCSAKTVSRERTGRGSRGLFTRNCSVLTEGISHPPPRDLYWNIFTFPFHPELEPWRSGKGPGLELICFLQTWHLCECFYLKWIRSVLCKPGDVVTSLKVKLRTVEYSLKIKHFNHYLYSYLLLM